MCNHTYKNTYMVRRLAFPAPPPPPYGLGGVGGGGGGAGVCGNGRGLARAPVLINLNLYFKPYPTLNPAYMQALSPKQNIQRKSSLSPCRLEALYRNS